MTFGCSFGYSIDMADHEVYPNAPLRLVTAEYRFPHSPALAEPHVDARLAECLGSGLPIIEPLEQPRDQSTAEMAVSLFNKYQRQFIHKLSDEGWLLEQANDKTDNKKGLHKLRLLIQPLNSQTNGSSI